MEIKDIYNSIKPNIDNMLNIANSKNNIDFNHATIQSLSDFYEWLFNKNLDSEIPSSLSLPRLSGSSHTANLSIMNATAMGFCLLNIPIFSDKTVTDMYSQCSETCTGEKLDRTCANYDGLTENARLFVDAMRRTFIAYYKTLFEIPPGQTQKVMPLADRDKLVGMIAAHETDNGSPVISKVESWNRAVHSKHTIADVVTAYIGFNKEGAGNLALIQSITMFEGEVIRVLYEPRWMHLIPHLKQEFLTPERFMQFRERFQYQLKNPGTLFNSPSFDENPPDYYYKASSEISTEQTISDINGLTVRPPSLASISTQIFTRQFTSSISAWSLSAFIDGMPPEFSIGHGIDYTKKEKTRYSNMIIHGSGSKNFFPAKNNTLIIYSEPPSGQIIYAVKLLIDTDLEKDFDEAMKEDDIPAYVKSVLSMIGRYTSYLGTNIFSQSNFINIDTEPDLETLTSRAVYYKSRNLTDAELAEWINRGRPAAVKLRQRAEIKINGEIKPRRGKKS